MNNMSKRTNYALGIISAAIALSLIVAAFDYMWGYIGILIFGISAIYFTDQARNR